MRREYFGIHRAKHGAALNDGLVVRALLQMEWQAMWKPFRRRPTVRKSLRSVRRRQTRFYILVYPLKCCHEVEQAGIAGFGVFVAVGGKVEEAEDVETVVERDYHRITFLGKV